MKRHKRKRIYLYITFIALCYACIPAIKANSSKRSAEHIVGLNYSDTLSIQHEIERKIDENKLLVAELELKNRIIQMRTITMVTLILLVVIIVCLLISRNRNYRLRQQMYEQEKEMARLQLRQQEEQLHALITSRQELHNRNEELRKQFKELKTQLDNTVELEKAIEMLHPSLLTQEEEAQFRQNFSSLYPTFLSSLRKEYPLVTKGEEIFCMLLILNQSNDEIARTLGINRSSVIKIRYRLRQKIKVDVNITLDDWVKSFLI